MSTEIQSTKQVISCRDLALTFLKLGSIGFGGGMAMIALMEHEFVGKRQVIKSEEFLHGVGLGQLLGPFAVNTAFFIGYREQGAVGGLLSAFSFMFPSFVLTIVLSWLYFAYHALPALQGVVGGLGPVVIALIISAAWTMGKKALRSWPAAVLAMLATIASLYRVSPVTVLVMAGVVGLALGKRRLSGGKPGKAASSPPLPKKGSHPFRVCAVGHVRSGAEHSGSSFAFATWPRFPQGWLGLLWWRLCPDTCSAPDACREPALAQFSGVH